MKTLADFRKTMQVYTRQGFMGHFMINEFQINMNTFEVFVYGGGYRIEVIKNDKQFPKDSKGKEVRLYKFRVGEAQCLETDINKATERFWDEWVTKIECLDKTTLGLDIHERLMHFRKRSTHMSWYYTEEEKAAYERDLLQYRYLKQIESQINQIP